MNTTSKVGLMAAMMVLAVFAISGSASATEMAVLSPSGGDRCAVNTSTCTDACTVNTNPDSCLVNIGP